MNIELPISKSIANRLLILQAIHGDGLLTVSDTFPDDVQILHKALTDINRQSPSLTDIHHINLGNCGTAMRFLTAYCAQLEGQTTILDGIERMHHRPIGQLVDALRELGAQIEYLGEVGYPPLRIIGCALDKHRIVKIDNPLSTQFVSALLLIGANVQTNSTSPYITLTRDMIKNKEQGTKNKDKLLTTDQTQATNLGSLLLAPYSDIERDWSSAAFWYEYVALHGGEIELPGLFKDSLQGDKIVAEIFTQLGVQTHYTDHGIIIQPITNSSQSERPIEHCSSYSLKKASISKTLSWDFGNCPDLYPAVALTCERLGVELQAIGTESLTIKESDRLRAVREHRTDHDHRMAMALLVAGYPTDDTDCIRKSYPKFLEQWQIIQNS